MKIGLITDVHEYSEVLAALLRQLSEAGAEKYYFLGDICSVAENLDATCKLLVDHEVEGVWGNHDFGLCEMARDGQANQYGEYTQSYCATLKPRIELDDIYMAHVEPWLDPNLVEDLWYLEGLPTTTAMLQRLFEEGDWSIAFAGHFHQWFHATPEGAQRWNGETPLDLSVGRHYVIIAACFRGYAAVFDTDTRILSPVWCDRLDVAGNYA